MNSSIWLERLTHLRAALLFWVIRVPDAIDGALDAKDESAVAERFRELLARCELKGNRRLAGPELAMAGLQATRDNVFAENETLRRVLADLGEPAHTLFVQLFFFGAIGLSIGTDTVLIRPMLGILGIIDPVLQTLCALSLIACPSVAFKCSLAARHRPGSVLTKRWLRVTLAVISILLVIGECWFRYRQLTLVDSIKYGPRFAEVLAGNSFGVFWVLLFAGVVLMATATWGMESLEHYWQVQVVSLRLARGKRKQLRLEKKIAALRVALDYKRQFQVAYQAACEARYRRGVAFGRTREELPNYTEMFIEGLDIRRAVLLAVGVIAGSLIAGLLTTTLLAKVLPGADAVFIGMLSALCIGSFTLFALLPKAEGPKPPEEPRKPMSKAAFITTLFLMLFSVSCSNLRWLERDASRSSRNIVIIVDASSSVRASGGDLPKAAMKAARRARRCDNITVIGVYTHTGDVAEKTIPCAPPAIPIDDDIATAFSELRAEVESEFKTWQTKGQYSDYLRALSLAAERLNGDKDGLLIVLGDMVDDQGPTATERAPKPPRVPALNGQSFAHTRAYLGFLDSSALDRLTHNERNAFAANWETELKLRGAVSVTSRAFGLQGLDAWLDENLGPSSGSEGTIPTPAERTSK